MDDSHEAASLDASVAAEAALALGGEASDEADAAREKARAERRARRKRDREERSRELADADRLETARAALPVAALPRSSPWRLVARALFVLAVLTWFGARRVVGALVSLVGGAGLTGPVALRLAFERLGPIYVKLGQLIASGEALFPEAYSNELRTLLDRVPPFAFAEVERIVQEDLGRPLAEVYASFERAPMAAASIAQVHGATVEGGREVVVKVQRPGIGELAGADVRILRGFARLASLLSPLARNSNLVGFVDDFETNLREELDFRHEAEAMRAFNRVMRVFGNERTAAPIVDDARTHARVLTMERFRGFRIDDVEGVRASGFDAEERLVEGIRAWFQTLILHGFFHGDVHAGNFMLLADGRIGYLDFGIVGRFDEDNRRGVLEYVLGFQQRDFARVADAMLTMKTVQHGREVSRDALAADLEATFAPMISPEDGFRLRDLVPGLLRSARRHGLRMPRELVLVTKQLVYLDRYSRAYGGDRMNVLTDSRLTNVILQDMFVASLR